ncbi:hypothetical protein SISSUDRAFT_1031001 [Sistotremastrum suecicum HHB10207 ss-3]|uniref:Glucose receptor Git3 N-terminal domain-containing protein n=1 Tax=Sistotremastrum suecicum HHB10207 ss-3 TaxID=1314776 RepID=A0A166GFY1_9AGAM|nr:hypothetical protein SISSUDRAFT_1031001 [Sistotremastrum suecicum HHB10207 ss-3]
MTSAQRAIYHRTDASEDCSTDLTPGQRVGMTIVSEAAMLSLFSVLLVLGYIGLSALLHRRRHQKKLSLFNNALDVYVFSLICFDLIQAIGGVLSIRWVNDGIVRCSDYCTTQGILRSIGDTGASMATIAIAFNTFVVIVFRRQLARLRLSILVAAVIWGFCVFFPVIGFLVNQNGPNPFFTPTPIGGLYIWLWIAALESFALYVPLFFILLSGTAAGQRRWWELIFLSNTDGEDNIDGTDDVRAASFKMLLFPFSYSVLVVPLSVCRFISFHHPNAISSQAIFIANSLFSLTGFVDVLLLINLRRDLRVIG